MNGTDSGQEGEEHMEERAAWLTFSPSLVVADAQRYVYYRPSPLIDLKIRPGDPIKPGSVTDKALRLEREVAEWRDECLFGVAYFGLSVPIKETGRLKGVVTLIFPQSFASQAPFPPTASFLTVWDRERWVPIAVEDIIYLEAQNRKTFIQATGAQGLHRAPLSTLEKSLPPDRFARIHRAYIVNVHRITEIHPDSHSTFRIVMSDGSRLYVSRSYAPLLRRRLGF